MIKFTGARPSSTLKTSVVIVVLGLAALIAPGRAQAQFSLFGGYSYLRASVPVGQFGPPTSQGVNLNGWEVSGDYKVLPLVGAVADFGGNYGTLDGAHVDTNTYLFGPQLEPSTSIAPFVHVLIGAAHERQDAVPNPAFFSLGSSTSFATAIGGGIDLKLIPFVAVRLIQIDELHTGWHGRSQNQPRISTGFVVHF